MVDEDKTPPKGTDPIVVDAALRDYLANEIAEQLRPNMPLMTQAIEQQMAKLWSPRIEALEDKAHNDEKNASPHFSNSKLREEHFETTGPSVIPPRRNGKDPLFPQDSVDPLDSFLGGKRTQSVSHHRQPQ